MLAAPFSGKQRRTLKREAQQRTSDQSAGKRGYRKGSIVSLGSPRDFPLVATLFASSSTGGFAFLRAWPHACRPPRSASLARSASLFLRPLFDERARSRPAYARQTPQWDAQPSARFGTDGGRKPGRARRPPVSGLAMPHLSCPQPARSRVHSSMQDPSLKTWSATDSAACGNA